MLTNLIALVSQTPHVTAGDLADAAGALQKQLVRDFRPLWGIDAQISAFPHAKHIPSDYWPIFIRDDINVEGAAGVHEDNHGQPFSLVQFSSQWALTASHEALEMLVDPFGRRLVAGQSPDPSQGRVNFLVEACDPCEDASLAYTINGVLVSDFYTPNYFDPVAAANVRYSFSGAILQPREVLKGGYLSWVVPSTGEWFQQTWFDGPAPTIRSLGRLAGSLKGSIRSTIDRLTHVPAPATANLQTSAASLASSKIRESMARGGEARAAALDRQIKGLLRA